MEALSPRVKIEAGKAFCDHMFWKSVMVPTINAQIAAKYAQLRICALAEVKQVRAEIDCMERLIDMPRLIVEGAKQDIELDRYGREQSGEAVEEGE